MSYGWLGTFRQGSWRSFRSYILNERRDVEKQLAVIQAELTRIGQIMVQYARDDLGNVTEERKGMMVTQGSSLDKLMRAYIAQGGNPFDISLFLTPDATLFDDSLGNDDITEIHTQPYGGVIYPKSDTYGLGAIYEGGFLVVKKYVYARVGGRKELEDERVANLVADARGWANQGIQEKRNDLEARIIKLMDLREQFLLEIDQVNAAIGGTMGVIPSLDGDGFNEELGVANIVAAIDRVFYLTDEDGVPQFGTINNTALPDYIFLLDDIEPEENNTAL